MNTNNNALPESTVTDEAWLWAVRYPELSAAENAELERWLAQDERHRAEFEAAKRRWEAFDVARHLRHEPVEQGDLGVAGARLRRARHRRIYRPMAAAAASLTAVAVAIWLWLPVDFQADYRTAIGEQQRHALPDGSAIRLNTNTRLVVHFTASERTVNLRHGEAHFQVGHDLERPFVVLAGGGVIRALGTAFNVHVHDDDKRVEVTVTDGEVEIAKLPAPANDATMTVTDIDPVPKQRVAEGHNAEITDTVASAAAVDRETLERKLSWQHGMLVFVDTPLGEVIAEASRYTVKSLVIADPEIKASRVTVVAKSADIDRLLRHLDDSNDAIQVTQTSPTRVLISRASPP